MARSLDEGMPLGGAYTTVAGASTLRPLLQGRDEVS
jgi:hypothetical protein